MFAYEPVDGYRGDRDAVELPWDQWETEAGARGESVVDLLPSRTAGPRSDRASLLAGLAQAPLGEQAVGQQQQRLVLRSGEACLGVGRVRPSSSHPVCWRAAGRSGWPRRSAPAGRLGARPRAAGWRWPSSPGGVGSSIRAGTTAGWPSASRQDTRRWRRRPSLRPPPERRGAARCPSSARPAAPAHQPGHPCPWGSPEVSRPANRDPLDVDRDRHAVGVVLAQPAIPEDPAARRAHERGGGGAEHVLVPLVVRRPGSDGRGPGRARTARHGRSRARGSGRRAPRAGRA